MQLNVSMLSLNCIKKTSWHKMITNVNCLCSAVRYPRCKLTSTQVNFDQNSVCMWTCSKTSGAWEQFQFTFRQLAQARNRSSHTKLCRSPVA